MPTLLTEDSNSSSSMSDEEESDTTSDSSDFDVDSENNADDKDDKNKDTVGDIPQLLCYVWLVMPRSGLVQFKGHFAQTLNRTYGSVQADC